jgi:RimJ/RimL family protein N-acetyltransferase
MRAHFRETGLSLRFAREDLAEFLIRRGEPADAAWLVALAREVGAEPEGWLLSTTEPRGAGDERRYLRSIRRSPHAAVFVAEAPEGVVARLSLARDPHPASRHVADLGLMVAAGHRRRGIGRALLERAVEWAREAGVSKLELHVFPHNLPALALYEQFGFVREGYRRRHYRRGREYIDAILMAYEVTPTLTR